jgi:hypothetical protein
MARSNYLKHISDSKKRAKIKGNRKNPEIGEFVFDKYYQKKRKVVGIPFNGNNLYYLGSDHEPVSRNEFTYPLPKKK